MSPSAKCSEAVTKFYSHSCIFIRDEYQVSPRPERAFCYGIKTSNLDVGRSPADASFLALVELRGWKRLPSKLASKIRAAGNDHFLGNHLDPLDVDSAKCVLERLGWDVLLRSVVGERGHAFGGH